MPLDAGVAAAGTDELTSKLKELMDQLQQAGSVGLTNPASPPALPALLMGQSAAAPVNTQVMADSGTQALLDQRRLFERLQSLPEVRLALGNQSANALHQDLGQSPSQHPALSSDVQNSTHWLGSASADLGLTPASKGDNFALQMSQMAELKSVAMPVNDGAASGPMAKSDMPDISSLAGAGAQRHVTPAVVSDARPTQSFIHVPLNDPRWQNEFNNRVTWLARASGNQTAEIRLNPANMGPIEVRVAMNDDQATITFTAQHGVVRDAIEASLPRLREMFTGSGLQLANANVSDQPLQDQRQRQQQGFGSENGNGHSQGGYGGSDQVNGVGDLVSPVSLSMLHSSGLVDRLDLYA